MSPEESHPAAEPSPQSVVLCATHQVALEPGKIDVTYQGHTFPVDTLRCPICGLALIPEEMAKGQMRRVEQSLEEK